MSGIPCMAPLRSRPSFLPPSRAVSSFQVTKAHWPASSQWATKAYPSSQIVNEASRNTGPNISPPSCLGRLPTLSILRSLFLSVFFTSPLLFRPGLAVFQAIANSPSRWLNPDKNPFLRAAIRPIVYDQFCAGRNAAEINKTSQAIKSLGFSGVVLCYGKEVQLDANQKFSGYDSKGAAMDIEIQQWRDGNLKTLAMIGEGDWLGIK